MEIGPILNSVSVHCWNKDRTQIAISPNNEEVHIYDAKDHKPKNWVKRHTLKEHTQFVSGIDWNDKNEIVTCSHDRNAYVWTLNTTTNEWEPNIVMLRISRSATSCKWSPAGNKIAVTSGSKWIQICYYEETNNWWVSKTLKKNRSTVTCVDWCPNNKFVVAGGCDKVCRIYSAFLEGCDSEEDDGFGAVWEDQHEFGEVLESFSDAGAWINAVAWAPSGLRLAFTGHGATMHFIQLLAGSKPLVQTLEMKNLPFLQLAFLDDDTLVGVGFDMNPVVFKNTSGSGADPEWKQMGFMDDVKNKTAAKQTGNKAMNMFKQMSKQGTSEKKQELQTFHKNFVTSLHVFPDSSGHATEFTCGSLDGRLVPWNAATLKHKAELGF